MRGLTLLAVAMVVLTVSQGASAEPSQSAGGSTGIAQQVRGESTARTGSETYLDQLVAAAVRLRLHETKTWRRLLHYRPATFGGWLSEADGPGFFLSENGKRDPKLELAATLRGLFSDYRGDPKLQHPYCRFPARLAWLNANLKFDFTKLRRRRCELFDEYMGLLEPGSITLVFASYYLNNPASAFGHTFLRVNKKRHRGVQREDLLDTGVDYSATVDTQNALLYAIKGLTGMFVGQFRRLPYYYKVREYNDVESRDIWEYELDLTQNEVDMVVAHIWELGSTYFGYFYMSENCSYHILATLEVAHPRLDLVEHVGWPVIPADTVKALYQNPGLVRQVHYRPSNRTQFKQRVVGLDAEEIDAVASLISDADAELSRLPSIDARVRALDAALDLVDARFAPELVQDLESEAAGHKQRLLERRAALKRVSQPFTPEVPYIEMPHRGHDSMRLGLGEGYASDWGAFQSLDFRLALHDLADPSAGYPETIQLEFLPLRARYYVENQRLRLDDAWLVRIRSYTGLSRFDGSISWKMGVGATTLRDHGCENCLAATAEMGGGGALSLFDQGVLLFLTTDVRLWGLSPIEGGINDWPLRAGVGPSAGLRLRFTSDLVALLVGDWLYLPVQDPDFVWSASQVLRWQYYPNFALGIEGQQQPAAWSAMGSSLVYF